NRLKKYGSGDLPKEVTGYKDGEISCKANDAFATIDIKIKIESEENYAKALDFLNRLLENEFPRSYAISFRCPQKNFLPIKGLPKKSVHTFFANAAAYEKLHGKIERYANLAMRQYEWYNNLEDEDCAMPGSFAIFALGLFSESYAPLICKYLKLCDGEHSSIQAKFVRSYIEKYGFSKSGIDIFVECAANIQELEPHKIYAQKIANEQSLRLLLAKKSELDEEYIWNSVLYALWNVTSKAKIAEVIKSAPNELKDIYEEVLASNEKGSL
ncbi:MAG: DUF6138 family protein, partial [Helicobacteraceae bacterium]|nr:DUF6138 family protein [Helicobacteraceae bacterium]